MMSTVQSSRAQRGFTLIEILVTVVLISVGLLGAVALQLTTLRGNQEAYVRSQASVLAADIMDRMRANPTAARNKLYNVVLNGTGDASTRAGQDLAAWQAAINQALPGGDATAAGMVNLVQNGSMFIVTVTIQWNERPEGKGTDGDPGGVRQFQTRSEI